jgi:hypothetical protein
MTKEKIRLGDPSVELITVTQAETIFRETSDRLGTISHLLALIWYRYLYIGPTLEAEGHGAEKTSKPKTFEAESPWSSCPRREK